MASDDDNLTLGKGWSYEENKRTGGVEGTPPDYLQPKWQKLSGDSTRE